MLQAAVDELIFTRMRLVKVVKDLTQEQWFAQPDGFVNNVAWNVGHLVIAQQYLCYGRLGLELAFENGLSKKFGGGTSPADWDAQPDTDELTRLLTELPEQLSADVAAGKFDSYVMPEPVEGRFPPAKTALHSFIFNQYHEGLHAGTIGELIGYMNSTS